MSSFHEIVAKALDAKRSQEESSLMETEEKFASLALAFRTDRHTLERRTEHHLRARDVAEKNIQKELDSLKDGIKALRLLCGDSQSTQQTFETISTHLEVLEQSIDRMSSRAENHGAVQHELRVSQVIETMVLHVENLKRTYETVHVELQEARKGTNFSRLDFSESTGSRKAGSGSTGTNKGGLRRVSLAMISKSPRAARALSLQSDSLLPTTASYRSISPLSFYSGSDQQDGLLDCFDEVTSTGPGEKSFLNRQNTTTAVANSVKSTVKTGGTRTLRGIRDRKYDNKRFVAKVTTPKSSVSDAEDDGTVKRIRDMNCQRRSVKTFLVWLTPFVRMLVPCSRETFEEQSRISFLFGALSKFLPRKAFLGFVIVGLLTLISVGFFLVIYRWWMASNYF